MSARRAVLVAEAVAVLCPYCEEAQPARNGSEFWTSEDFGWVLDGVPHPACVSCDRPITILADTKVTFR